MGLDNPRISELAAAGPQFVRDDVNQDGTIDISDAISTLDLLFIVGTPPSDCPSAVDANDDGANDISDAIWSLSYLFSSGPALAAPFPDCGEDGTPDGLECAAFATCP